MTPVGIANLRDGLELPATTYRLDLPGLVVHAGACRDFAPIHFDEQAARIAGARGPFINNVYCLGMWERTVRDLLGPSGVVHALRNVRMTAFNCVGDDLVTTGRVERAWDDGAGRFAEISLQTFNNFLSRVTVGPGTVVVSCALAGGPTDAENLQRRYDAVTGTSPMSTEGRREVGAAAPWDGVAAMIGENLLVAGPVPGADRVDASVVRRLCESLQLRSALHEDESLARSLGYEGAVAPTFGVGTTYVARRLDEPDLSSALPLPSGSVEILSEVGLELLGPIHVGDLLAVASMRITSVTPKRTAVGDGAFVTEVSEVASERRPVATVTKSKFLYRPDPELEPA